MRAALLAPYRRAPHSLSAPYKHASRFLFLQNQPSQTPRERFSSHSSQLTTSLPSQAPKRVLQHVPLSTLLRSLTVLSVAALPSSLLSAVITVTKKWSRLISASAILRWPVDQTFYKTFCIGSEKQRIEKNIGSLRAMGLDGIVLAFARESKLGNNIQTANLTPADPSLREWVDMNLETIDCLTGADYLALRLTGAGPAAVEAMDDFSELDSTSDGYMASLERLNVFGDALSEILTAAANKDVKVLIDAESSVHQPAIDRLALDAMARFNKDRAVVYNTYQMYLKKGVSKMIRHLKTSKERGFVIGLKLVRGAYLHTEPNPSSLNSSKENTDESYDNGVRFLLGAELDAAKYGTSTATSLERGEKPWAAEVMLATHNQASVDNALSLWRGSTHPPRVTNRNGGNVRSLAFAQLMGMADEVSLGLVSERKGNGTSDHEADSSEPLPPIGVYKYTIWGSFEECLLYMLRRAEENQDAVARTRGSAMEVLREVGRRANPFKS
ncbi:FAD-linked oxidoreductase-like protein [Thelonectria olida]|uniref:Proline dehydrogenase n=1 Tax=Thelonectria olida TaxID=1576542 RepID=A0A9P8W7B0_9HYPO|nr:FAD-linked oxidoreductase-like protein [Thelonectria olida]